MPTCVKKRANGRPTKFTQELAKKIYFLAKFGLTDKQLAEVFDINEVTINRWKSSEEFSKSLKDSKAEIDAKVENSLFQRAMGYSHPETKVFCNDGEIIETEVIRHYPPDTSSMIFWLKNRQPDRWRDVQERKLSGNVTLSLVDMVRTAIQNPRMQEPICAN